MGFFDFLKKKEEVSEPQDAGSVELAKVKETIERSISSDITKERERMRELYARIKENFREVKKLNKELSGKSFESGQRVDAPVNMIKDNYVRKTLSLLNNIPVIDNFEYGEITDFCSGTEKVLKDLQKIPPKQTILLSKYFKGETSRIIKTLKDIERMSKEMKSLLEGKALWLGGKINSKIDRIFELKRKSKDMEKQENTLREKIKDKRNEKGEKEKDLAGFVSSEEFKGFENLGFEIKELGRERSEIENEIREELSGVKRPLKKLEYDLKHREGKEKVSLSKVAHSPMKVLLEQGGSVLMEALVKLRNLNLKENERERVEGLIKKIENGEISKLRERYKQIENEIREKKEREEKSDVTDKKRGKEREIENLTKEIQEHEKEIEKISGNRKKVSEGIEKERKDLEGLVRKEININLNIIV